MPPRLSIDQVPPPNYDSPLRSKPKGHTFAKAGVLPKPSGYGYGRLTTRRGAIRLVEPARDLGAAVDGVAYDAYQQYATPPSLRMAERAGYLPLAEAHAPLFATVANLQLQGQGANVAPPAKKAGAADALEVLSTPPTAEAMQAQPTPPPRRRRSPAAVPETVAEAAPEPPPRRSSRDNASTAWVGELRLALQAAVDREDYTAAAQIQAMIRSPAAKARTRAALDDDAASAAGTSKHASPESSPVASGRLA